MTRPSSSQFVRARLLSKKRDGDFARRARRFHTKTKRDGITREEAVSALRGNYDDCEREREREKIGNKVSLFKGRAIL